uniref:MARVEL domain-containing protein n=1 Tax=Canis lupus familiaris TaxID=9615 RepID=A0A8C0P5L1_CANLF
MSLRTVDEPRLRAVPQQLSNMLLRRPGTAAGSAARSTDPPQAPPRAGNRGGTRGPGRREAGGGRREAGGPRARGGAYCAAAGWARTCADAPERRGRGPGRGRGRGGAGRQGAGAAHAAWRPTSTCFASGSAGSARGCPPSSSTSARSRSRWASSRSSSGLNEASFLAHPDVNVCDVNWKSYVLIGDYSSSAQFYVTFAVFVFLYCIAALLLYVGYTSLYRDSRKLPMIDFVVTLVAAFLWLVSTSAWAKALTDIKIATGHGIVKELQPCNHQGVTCYFGSVTSMGSLNVSVIFGFLNMILWGGNAWFVVQGDQFTQSIKYFCFPRPRRYSTSFWNIIIKGEIHCMKYVTIL